MVSEIEIKNLSFTYQTQNQAALQHLSVEIQAGEFILLTGPSGCGKSTLIRTLNGLIPHFYGGIIQGKIRIKDLNVLQFTTRDLAQTVGMVFQNPDNQVLMHTVESEIAFGLENLNLPSEEIIQRIETTLNAIGISSLRKRSIQELSGGEKQKVAIAAVLAMRPQILILDEPTAELDPHSADQILQLIRQVHAEFNLTILLIEHRIDRVAQYADRIVIMENHRIVLQGLPKDIFTHDLKSIGIAVPPIIKTWLKLVNLGIVKGDYPLNITQAIDQLKPLISRIKKPIQIPPNWLIKDEDYQSRYQNLPPLIQLEHVGFNYPNSPPFIQDLNFKANLGEFIAIIGDNGSGKTTFLKLINGLLRPKHGKVMINHRDIASLSIAQIAHDVGFIFQNPAMQFYQDTLEDEFRFILTNLKVPNKNHTEQITEILSEFGIQSYQHTYPRYLSWGEQQRAALASVLMVTPSILLLDEPTHGLDYQQKVQLLEYLDRYRRAGHTVILVSHDIEIVAEFADRVVILENGRISDDGICRKILSSHPKFQSQLRQVLRNFPAVPTEILTPKDFIQFIELNSFINHSNEEGQ